MKKKESQEILKMIKEMMKDSHRNVPYIKETEQRMRKEWAKRIEESQAEYPDDMLYWKQKDKERMIANMEQDISSMYDRYDSENLYYLIYKDGSCVCISDSDLISGEKMPKLTGIVYAMYSGTCDSWDTETGELHWYEGSITESDFDWEAEDERKMAYENAIEIKYGTEFGKRLQKMMEG